MWLADGPTLFKGHRTTRGKELFFQGALPLVKRFGFTSWQFGARPSHPDGGAPSVCLSYLHFDRVITTDLP